MEHTRPLLLIYARIYQVVTTLETLYSSDRRTGPAEILLRLHTGSGIATDKVLIRPRPDSMHNIRTFANDALGTRTY